MKFVRCNTRMEFNQIAGYDWAKVVKVEGGYIGFDTMDDYRIWRAQQ